MGGVPPGGKKEQRLSVLALVAVAVIWGWGFIFVRLALDAGLSPEAVMVCRFGIAALLMLVLFFKQLRAHYQKGQWKSGLVVGGALFLGFYVQTVAMQYTTPANNAFITGIYVVLVPLLLWAVSKKRPGAITFVCCLLSFVGVGILSLDFSAGFAISFGDGLTLLSAVFFAAQIVATGKLANSIHPTVLVFMQFCVAAVLSLGALLATGGSLGPVASPKGAVSIAYLATFSTCVCYGLQTVAQKHLAPAKVGILLACEALFAALFSVLVGYDKPSLRMVLGGLVMFAAVVLPEVWQQRKSKGESMPAQVQKPEKAQPGEAP